MPGLNQRGPQGQGPMTGRGQGVCQNPNITQGRGGGGFAAGRGGRGCRRGAGGGGGGGGRGMGREFGYAAAPAASTEAELQDRARILEDELNTVKAQLNARSQDDTD